MTFIKTILKRSFKLIFFFSFCFSIKSCIKKTEIDLILHNSTIYSINDNNDVFEAIAINKGKIIATGKNNQILNKFKSNNTIDLKGKFIYPGFIDAHCHFLAYGLQQNMIDLSSAKSFNDIISLLKNNYSKTNNEWIIGFGWDQNQWHNKKWPNNELLNEEFKNKNIVLKRVDGHAIMVNQKAIETLNIKTDTLIDGGYIEVIDDKLTGLFIDNAMDLILNKIPEPNEDVKKSALLKAQEDCFSLGLTTVDIAGMNKVDVELIQNLQNTEELKIKVFAMLSDNEENFSYFIDSIGEPIKTDKLNIRSFKFFADGSLGSRGACLLKPYSDLSSSSGFMLQEKISFEKKLLKLKDCGFQACTHAIGDSANRSILMSYGKTLGTSNDLRWRIEHAQCVSDQDIVFFNKFNIIPSVQPTHATSDFSWAIRRLGKKRLLNCYRYSSLFNQNSLIALGTDFPVEKINPLNTFYAAVFRKNHSGDPIEGFQKDQALSRDQAIKGMTIWAALGNFEENEKGSLEIGKSADITVLNKDLFKIDEKEIKDSKVIKTIVNGEVVYSF